MTARLIVRAVCIGLYGFVLHTTGFGQTALSWEQIKTEFRRANPSLKAAELRIEEARAAEITAYLRPNPTFNLTQDGTQLLRSSGVWQPFAGTQVSSGISYLRERQHKRELRREKAQQATAIEQLSYLDLERNLLFQLRTAFVQVLQAKAVLQNAEENLRYWDRVLTVNRRRFNTGDLAQVDLNRLELQRAQLEADFETAKVRLATAKIQLLTLLNARIPVEDFDVVGSFDFNERLLPIDEYRAIALEMRPDLRAARQTVNLAETDHQLAIANGSTDPTISAWVTKNASFNNPFADRALGATVSIPLRIFDRNQGEKARTQIEVARSQRLVEAVQAGVLSDVESAYWTLLQNLNLLKAYKSKYLSLAEDNRNRISVAFVNGGASLLDFLDAEKALRDTRLAYLNLVGSYLTTAAQMNLAIGREVAP